MPSQSHQTNADASARQPQMAMAWCIAVLLGLAGVLFLVNTSCLPLVDPDEARYATVVREMLRGRGWIVPHLAGQVYMDKPAPYFWLAAVCTWATGDVELGGRLVSAIFATMACLVTFAFARSVAGNRAGLLAGVILLTAPGPLITARLYRMDMPLVALMWAGTWWFWRYETPAENAAGRRGRQWPGFYAFCAGATLMKGPIGLGIPGLVVGAYLLLSGRPKRIVEVFHLPGIALYLLIVAPWYAAVSYRQGGYLYEFFVRQNLVRYAAEAIDGKSFPSVYFVAVVLGCMMPWTVYLPGACVRTFPRRWKARAADPAMLFGWLAALVPLAFFMLGRTRLAVYVLPVAPPLAALIAIPLARWAASRTPDRLYRAGVVALLIALAVMPIVAAGVEARFGWLDAWFALPAAGTLAALVLMCAAIRRGHRGRFLGWAVAGLACTAVFVAEHTAVHISDLRSMASLGRMVRRKATDEALVCYFGERVCSFGLYADRTEAKCFGLHQKADRQELVQLLGGPRPVYCLVEGRSALRLLEGGLGRALTVLGTQDDCLLVTNKPPPESPPSPAPAAPSP